MRRGNTATYDYDFYLETATVVDTRGRTTVYEFNGGSITRIIDSNGGITNYTYDDAYMVNSIIDINGNVHNLKQEQIDTKPSCLISSDLFGVSHYIAENTDRTKGLIIDGSAGFVNYLQLLDDEILKKNIPTVVITDLFDSESIMFLKNRYFNIWQWNRKNINECIDISTTSDRSPFYSFSQSIANYCFHEIEKEICECFELEEIMRSISKLNTAIPESPQLKEAYGELVSLTLELSRMLRIPDHNWILNAESKIQKIRKQFETHSMWLKEDVVYLVDRIFSNIDEYKVKNFTGENHKIKRLGYLLDKI